MEEIPSFAAAYAAGRSAWGELAVSPALFAEYVATRELSPFTALAHARDLYLCAACASGQVQAYQALEAAHFPALGAVLWRLLGDRPTVQELLQELRIRLFVGSPPRITTYRGSGSLSSWLRTIAIHAAQDHVRARKVQRGRLRKLSSAQLARAVDSYEPAGDERLLFGQPREHIVQRACSAALAALEQSQLRLLRHYYVGGLSIDALSPLYAVHRATVARRLRRALNQLRELVRQELAARYQLSRREIDELVRDACAEIDLSGELLAGETHHAA